MRDKPVFTTPANPGIKIWRYMDFTKFVSMLENGGLFFARADQLEDEFEARDAATLAHHVTADL